MLTHVMDAVRHATHPTPPAIVRALVRDRREAFEVLRDKLQLDAVGLNPVVPVEEIEGAGFGVEWRMAAENANRQFGFQGTIEEIDEAARFRNFEFCRIVNRQLKRSNV